MATPRLRLRPLAGCDAALFAHLYGDPDTMRFIERPWSKADARRSFRATLRAARGARGPWFFAIVRRATDASAGLCAIRFSARTRRAQLGVMLMAAERGKGIASESFAALLNAAFETLPIDAVWVQYRAANAAAARLITGLGFLPDTAARSSAAQRRRCVGVMQRSAWRARAQPTTRGNTMSSIIRFLESAGRDAALRHAAGPRLQAAMQQQQVAPRLQSAVLNHDRARIDDLIGGVHKIHCLNFPVRVPKKAPAKAPAKKPVKAPPKKKAPAKAPAKKPAKKRTRGAAQVTIH